MGHRAIASSILAISLLTGVAAGTVAQDKVAEPPETPAFFSYSISEDVAPTFVEGEVAEPRAGLTTTRGREVSGLVIEAGDARASGTLTTVLNESIYTRQSAQDIIGVASIARRITNEVGSWSGTGNEAIYVEMDPEGGQSVVQLATLAGEGGYDGLSLILLETNGEAVGWIVPSGDLPAVPELPAK